MIPKVIHQIWVGSQLPMSLANLCQTWINLHPDWQYKIWTDDNLGTLHNQHLFDNASDYVPAHAVGQLKADILRYEILYEHGGMYVDCDFEALEPIDGLIKNYSAFAVQQPDGKTIANGLIGVESMNKAIGECIDLLPKRAAKNKGRSAAAISGPHMFGPLALKHRFKILPSELFFPYSWKDVEQGNLDYNPEGCYAVHHWLHRRQMFSRPL